MIYGPDIPLYLRLYLTLKSKFDIAISPCGAHTSLTDTMAVDDARKILDGISKAQQITWIDINGGEPFLFYDEILQILEYVNTIEYPNQKRIEGKVTTSAFWASDAQKTARIIDGLKDKGADRMDIRFDALYNEYVPYERIKNAVITARQKGIVLQVISYILYPSGDICSEKGPYTGEITNETDRKTVELQNMLAEFLPKRCIEWERAKLTLENKEVQKLLGERFNEAVLQSQKAYSNYRDTNGKINTSITAEVFPNGETIINGKRIGNSREKEIDILLRDFLIESRLSF